MSNCPPDDRRQPGTPAFVDAYYLCHEQDACVARALGWTVETGVMHLSANEPFPWMVFVEPDGTKHNPIPWSTDLVAALPLAHKLIADGWRFSLDCSWSGWTATFRSADFTIHEGGDTAALAIVKAFLGTVEIMNQVKEQL